MKGSIREMRWEITGEEIKGEKNNDNCGFPSLPKKLGVHVKKHRFSCVKSRSLLFLFFSSFSSSLTFECNRFSMPHTNSNSSGIFHTIVSLFYIWPPIIFFKCCYYYYYYLLIIPKGGEKKFGSATAYHAVFVSL